MLKPCSCSIPQNIAIVTVLVGEAEKWQIDFVGINQGKFICYDCGGEVSKEVAVNNYDHITANTVTERLRELEII